MIDQPSALLIRFPGTNCDAETARALSDTGFAPRVVPVSIVTPDDIFGSQIVVFSGGFSYGDYVMSGRIAQLVAERKIPGVMQEFIKGGGHALGICNGFQILTKMGLLPTGSLIDNTSGKFQCRWTRLQNRNPESAPLRELPDEFELPIAHAEGRFVAPPGMAEEYVKQGLAALTYADDVNGSSERIAGLQDETGRVFGLMPHPERFLYREHHYDPDWNEDALHGWGWYFFRSLWRDVSGARKLIAA